MVNNILSHHYTSVVTGVGGISVLDVVDPSADLTKIVLQLIIAVCSLLPAYWNYKKNKSEKK